MTEHFPTFRRIGKRLFPTFRRIGKKMGKVLLVLIVVLAVVHGIATFITGRRLEARINALKAKGEPVSWADFGKPKVPDAENAAVIYAKAFKVIQKLRTGGDYSKLNSFLKPYNRQGNPELWNDVRRMLAENRGAFPLVEQALARPKCQFPVNWEAGFDATFPHYGPLRRLTRLLAADAIIQAHDGRMDKAVHSIDLSLRIGKSIPDDPTVISSLVQVAMIKSSTNALRHVLTYRNISEAQANRLHHLLESIDTGPGFVRAMQGERVCGLWTFDYVRKHPGALWHLTSGGLDSSERFWWAPIGYLQRPFFYADELYCLDYMTAGVERSRLTFREAARRRADSSYDPIFPRWAIISNMFTPVFFRARMEVDAAMAEAAGSRVALALRVYKNRYGSYPRTLDELRAKLGWEIPTDIFSGEDFVYKPQGKGFLLYSIGGNLKDDGARPFAAPRPLATEHEGYRYENMQGEKVADIVWEFDR